MTALEASGTTAAPTPDLGSGRIDHGRPLWQHAVVLFVLLLAMLPVLGGVGLFSGDEGAALAQAELLIDEGTWGFDPPRPDLDPDNVVGPFDRADHITGAPFAKHPAYPVLLIPFVAVGGTAGAKVLSLVGTVLAALAAALIAGRLRDGLERPTLWIAGLASPLLFNGWVVIAHTLAAAAGGFAALLVLDGLRRPGRRARMLGVAVLVVAGILVRNEAVLFGIALGLGAIGVGVRERSRPVIGLGLAALVGTVAGYILDTYLTDLVASPDPFVVGQTLNSSNYVLDRVFPTVHTLLMPVRGPIDGYDVVAVLSLGFAVAAAVIIRRRPDDQSGIILMAALAAGAALLRLTGPATAIPGLLPAFPLLVVGVAQLSRQRLRQPAVVLLGSVSVLYVGAVLATQYETGGSAEWGFRYAAAGLSLLVPLAVLGLADAAPRLKQPAKTVAVAALAVLSLASAALSLRVLDRQHRVSVQAVSTIEAVRAESDRPVVATTYLPIGRVAWAEILSGEDWTLADEDGEMEDLAARLAEDGGDVVLVTTDPDGDLEPFEDTHEVVLQVPAVPSGQLEVLRLVRR